MENLNEDIIRILKLMEVLKKEKINDSIIFGDEITDYLDKKNLDEIPQLKGSNLKMKNLISSLKEVDKNPNIKNVFFSIGKNDRFENEDLIDILSDRLRDKFPNAKLNVIKPILDDDDYSNISSDVIPNENKIEKFYDEFRLNDIDVIGDYEILDIDKKDIKIKSLENEIYDKITLNSFDKNFNTFEPNLKNVNIQGEDETDFDTIYEFINRFENIVKSNNEYLKDSSSSSKPDIEQIQIVLKFLDKENEDLEVNGEIDPSTEEAIENFQKNNNLEVTGVIDNETLDELLYELRVKGFDDFDLAKYMKELGIIDNVKVGSDLIKYDKPKKSDKVAKAVGLGAVGLGAGIIGGSLIDSGKTSKVAGTKSEDDRIYRAILDGVGADDTEENMLYFKAWRMAEGAMATFNPFNTTHNMPGATKYNSVGVRNFMSEKDGIDATIKTLKNGYYPCILEGLRKNVGAKKIAGGCLSNLKTWGTGDLIYKVLNRGGTFTPPPIYRI